MSVQADIRFLRATSVHANIAKARTARGGIFRLAHLLKGCIPETYIYLQGEKTFDAATMVANCIEGS
jgi:hypothetical protein